MVDLRKAHVGDTVKFRCGGTAVIEEMHNYPNQAQAIRLCFTEYENRVAYTQDGLLSLFNEKHPLDIIEVIPLLELFDRTTVKWGMAFRDIDDGTILKYVGRSFDSSAYAIFKCDDPSAGDFVTEWLLEDLTRAPEHDIKEVG